MMKNKNIQNFGEFNENLNISDVSDSDLFQAEYNGEKIKIKREFLKQGEERELLKHLKKFNLGSGHEEMKLSKIDNNNFVFRLETYTGGPTQTIYFKRLK
jgi:predicted nuclease of restriction endonuclease-like (RecB) superfamily